MKSFIGVTIAVVIVASVLVALTEEAEDYHCGPKYGGKSCSGAYATQCCSRYGACGLVDNYCLVSFGCQRKHGRCRRIDMYTII